MNLCGNQWRFQNCSCFVSSIDSFWFLFPWSFKTHLQGKQIYIYIYIPLAGTNRNIGNNSKSFKYVNLWPNLRQFYLCAFFKFPHWNLGICLEWSSPYGYPHLTQETFYIQMYPFRATLPFVSETTYIPFRLLALLLVCIFLNKK